MSLAIFDLDNTLIAGDSDYQWGQFLVDIGAVDRDAYEAANAQFYEDYKHGRLDIDRYLAFALAPLARHDMAQLHAWHAQFVETRIRPIWLPAAAALVEEHRRRGDALLVITATNLFVAGPIARLYGITNIIATTPEVKDGRYTGRPEGVPCFREGKVTRLMDWLTTQHHDLKNSWFYSDSQNDLPLLSAVGHPVVIDPDPVLAAAAVESGWPILSLRGPTCPVEHLDLSA